MDADSVVIEYLRKKLSQARGGAAANVLKPPMPEGEMPQVELSPEEQAEIEAMLAEEDEEEMA